MVARNHLRIRLPLLLAVTMLGTSCREHTMLRMHQDSADMDTQGAVHDALPTAPSTRASLLTGSADQKSVTGSVGSSSVPLIHDTAMAEHIQYIHACAQTVTPQDLPEVISKLAWIEINLQKAYSKVKPKEKECFQSIFGKLKARQRDLIYARKAMGRSSPIAWWTMLIVPFRGATEYTLKDLKKANKIMRSYPKLAPKVASSVLDVLQKIDKEKICAPESTLKHVLSFLRGALQSAPQHTTRTLRFMKKIVKKLQDSGEVFENACIDRRLIDTLTLVAERNAAHVKRVLKVLQPICDHCDALVATGAIGAYMKLLKDYPQYDNSKCRAHLRMRMLQIDEPVQDDKSKQLEQAQQGDVKNQKDEKVIGIATQSVPRVGPVQAPKAVLRRPTVQLHTSVGSSEYAPASRGKPLPAIAEAP